MTTAHLPIALPPPVKPRLNKAAWVVVSVGLHAGLLASVLLWAPTSLVVLSNPPSAIFVDIEPLVLPRDVPARAPASESTANDSPAPARTGPTIPVPRAVRTTPSTSTTADAPRGSTGPIATDPADRQWTYTPESTASAVGRSVRTSAIGCAYPERLSEGERQVCAERATDRAVSKLEEGLRIGGTGNARRDAALEAEGRSRLSGHAQRRRPIGNSEIGNAGPSDTPGSNFGIGAAGRHLDPSLQPDAVGPIQTRRRDGPPEQRIQRTPH